jgi:hypothetical protein
MCQTPETRVPADRKEVLGPMCAQINPRKEVPSA